MDVYGKLIDILVFCVVGFLLPALLIVFFADNIKETYSDIRLRAFAENVSTKGYVDYTMYESFVAELNAAGVIVNPEIYVEHDLLAPEYVMRTIDDTEGYLDGMYGGSNIMDQPEVNMERPAVTDPGTPPVGSLAGNVAGANTSTTGPAAGHTHDGDCYSGTQHIHDESCPSRKVACTAGCSKHTHNSYCGRSQRCGNGCSPHTHSGSGSSGGGCYGEQRFSVCSGGYSYGPESAFGYLCSTCGKSRTGTSRTGYCSVCGQSVTETHETCGCGSFGVTYGSVHGYYWYQLNCGKSEGVYYSGSYPCGGCGGSGTVYYLSCGMNTQTYYGPYGQACTVCDGSGQVDSLACTKTDGGYYLADGTPCTPLCDKVVTGLLPVIKEQVIPAGESIDARVKAEFSDGHTEIVNAAVSGYNSTLYNVVQTVTLSYGTYKGSVSTSGATSITIKVMVRYPTTTCANGHLYYLVNGNTTLCPYCAAYPKTLTVLGATQIPFCITKGTTLSDNGISLEVTYYDGRVELITSGWTDNLDRNYVGEQDVTITYKGAYTTLKVKNERRKVNCSVCGYEYALYPDNTDPGCPKCLSAIPVFTGNVLRYRETISHGEILDELYHGDGIYYFSRGDRLELELWKTANTATNSVFKRLFGTGIGEELVCMYGVKIRDEEVEK